MATDATGAPTPLGIPKYNPSVDAPSGLGFNAAMDAIDTLVANRAEKPAGIASGEVPVWNGTTWVRSSVTRVGPTSLGSGTPDVAKFLRGDGAWAGDIQTYTPVWTTTGTAPAIGNGSINGRYIRIGAFVFISIRLVAGSTTTFGTGEWRITLPINRVGSSAETCLCQFSDAGTGTHPGLLLGASPTQMAPYTFTTPIGSVTNTSPFTWAVNDVLDASFFYEAA